MTGKRILVVDDETKITAMVRKYLESENFIVLTEADGDAALATVRREQPDLVVLDVMLPGRSGFDVCRSLRQETDIPVILLTAKTDEIDKLLGLELGADDYITKPFSLRELTARIRTVLRRVSPREEAPSERLAFDDLIINLANYEVKAADQTVQLTPTEFKIFVTLARNPGRVFSRLQLLDAALGETYEGYERSVDTHISNLRRKIETDPANPRHIVTVYGLGYKFLP